MPTAALRQLRGAWAAIAALALALVPLDSRVGRAGVDEAPGADLIGTPSELTVEPAALTLDGPRAAAQLVMTGRYADGSLRDLTGAAEVESARPECVRVSAAGALTPVGDGEATIRVRAGSRAAAVRVTVRGMKNPPPVSFRHEVIPVLTRAGCNAGACHGTPSGKNGFRLSLRGYLPDLDYESLTHDMLGRRTNGLEPDGSLILLKPTARVPHEGGKRFEAGSAAYRVLCDWIAQGRPADAAAAPRLERLEVIPARRLATDPCRTQQLAALAHFSDGSVRDVTQLAAFDASGPASADVSATGRVTSQANGELAVLVRYLDATATSRLTFLRNAPGFVWPDPPEANYIDRHVFAKLRELRVAPAPLAADDEFLRRAFLDVAGVLPSPDEARRFLADPDPAKRARLIDALLDRPEHADYWSMKWADKLGANNRFLGAAGVYKYRQWIRHAVAVNQPFDVFVRELLTSAGPNYAHPASGFYRRIRDPDSRVETVAQLFLGVRIQCARCHNHPFERWTQDDYYGLAAFFARVRYKDSENFVGIYNKEEVVYADRSGELSHPRTGGTVTPKLLGGDAVRVPEGEDRRRVLADWLTDPRNPFFARAAVNRIWFHLFGRGIVEPVDDFRDSNPPSNDELLDALAADFVAHGFDTRHMIRTIMNSHTYQLGSKPAGSDDAEARTFAHARLRLLGAEQLLDAISSLTGSPERFAGLPLGTRAAELPDGEYYHRFLRTFGQPLRSSACECEREGDSNLSQALELIGGRVVHNKLRSDAGRVAALAASGKPDQAIVEELYLAALARFPAADERALATERLAASASRRSGVEDLTWALINSKEFLFQH